MRCYRGSRYRFAHASNGMYGNASVALPVVTMGGRRDQCDPRWWQKGVTRWYGSFLESRTAAICTANFGAGAGQAYNG
jgi:hypothetical protein